jgi:hypothetical protein
LNTLARIVLLLAGALVLFYAFGIKAPQIIKGDTDIRLCQHSAWLNDISRKVDVISSDPMTELQCPMRDITIEYKDVKKGFGDVSQNKIKNIIAEEMRLCWQMMGNGEYLPFDQGWLTFSRFPCVVCSHISFDEKLQEKVTSGKVESFYEYLFSTDVSKGITYGDFLYPDNNTIIVQIAGAGGITDISNWAYNGEDIINYLVPKDFTLNDEYYIIYKVSLENKISDIVPSFIAPKDSRVVVISKGEKIKSSGCDYIANSLTKSK